MTIVRTGDVFRLQLNNQLPPLDPTSVYIIQRVDDVNRVAIFNKLLESPPQFVLPTRDIIGCCDVQITPGMYAPYMQRLGEEARLAAAPLIEPMSPGDRLRLKGDIGGWRALYQARDTLHGQPDVQHGLSDWAGIYIIVAIFPATGVIQVTTESETETRFVPIQDVINYCEVRHGSEQVGVWRPVRPDLSPPTPATQPGDDQLVSSTTPVTWGQVFGPETASTHAMTQGWQPPIGNATPPIVVQSGPGGRHSLPAPPLQPVPHASWGAPYQNAVAASRAARDRAASEQLRRSRIATAERLAGRLVHVNYVRTPSDADARQLFAVSHGNMSRQDRQPFRIYRLGRDERAKLNVEMVDDQVFVELHFDETEVRVDLEELLDHCDGYRENPRDSADWVRTGDGWIDLVDGIRITNYGVASPALLNDTRTGMLIRTSGDYTIYEVVGEGSLYPTASTGSRTCRLRNTATGTIRSIRKPQILRTFQKQWNGQWYWIETGLPVLQEAPSLPVVPLFVPFRYKSYLPATSAKWRNHDQTFHAVARRHNGVTVQYVVAPNPLNNRGWFMSTALVMQECEALDGGTIVGNADYSAGRPTEAEEARQIVPLVIPESRRRNI